MESQWSDFFKEKMNSPPRPEVVSAMEFVNGKDAALDLGAGTLRDSKYFLREGFTKVVAVDAAQEVKTFGESIDDERLQTVVVSFEDFDYPKHHFDIISAQYALPFANQSTFKELIQKIKDALKPGGIFTGTFFGVDDSWNVEGGPATVFHTSNELQELFSDFIVRSWVEDKEQDAVVGANTKDWHRFQIVVEKKRDIKNTG